MRLRSFIILLLVLIHLSVAGQVTKSITKKFDGSQQVSEHYAVLKSNKLTKHGPYTSYFRLNKEQQNSVKKGQDSLNYYVKQRGTYVQGKKHGEWMEYSRPNVFYTQGNYQQDKKIGIWATSRANGEVIEHYDYDYNIKLTPEIRIVINYPRKMKEGDIQGTVVIQYQLQTDCSISDLKVIKSLSTECDQEATKTVLKYYKYLQEYGPVLGCEAKIDRFKVKFQLE